MIENITVQLAIRIVAAIIVLWFASIAIRREGVVWPFAPLFVYFVALDSTAAAEFYEIFSTDLQTIFDTMFLIFYIWLLAVVIAIVRRSENNPNQ